MLTNVENRLEQLFEMIELMPPDKVEQAEKVIINNNNNSSSSSSGSNYIIIIIIINY